MKSVFHFAALVVCSLFMSCMTGLGEKPGAQLDEKSAGAAAEEFLAGYLKADAKAESWMAKTALATPAFKAAFKKDMAAEEIDEDPVTFAQDVPTTPFKTESAKVKGETATVLVATKFGKEPFKLAVTLVAKEGRWLVSKTAPAKS